MPDKIDQLQREVELGQELLLWSQQQKAELQSTIHTNPFQQTARLLTEGSHSSTLLIDASEDLHYTHACLQVGLIIWSVVGIALIAKFTSESVSAIVSMFDKRN